MSLFKIFRGQKDDLDHVALHDGYSYVAVTNDNTKAATFYTDAPDSNGRVKRYEIGITEAERDAWNAKVDASDLSTRVATAQGSSNYGKILGVDDEGNVAPMEVSALGGALTWGALAGQ